MCIYLTKYPCGHCYQCQAKKRNDMIQRLRLEYDSLPDNGFALFGLLSYSDDGLELSKDVHTSTGEEFINWQRNISLYVKRIRKQLPFIDFAYYIASEYGKKTHRLHHHPIFFIKPKTPDIVANMRLSPAQLHNYEVYRNTLNSSETFIEWDLSHNFHVFNASQHFIYQILKSQWQEGKYKLGFCFLSVLDSSKGIAYVTKYIHKQYSSDFETYSDNSSDSRSYYRQHLVSNGLGASALLPFDDIVLVEDSVDLQISSFRTVNYSFSNFSRPLRYDDPTPRPNTQGSYALASYLRDKVINSIYLRSYHDSNLCNSYDNFVEYMKRDSEFRFLLSYMKTLVALLRSYKVGYYFVPIYDDEKPVSLSPLPIDFRLIIDPCTTVQFDKEGVPQDACSRFDFAISSFIRDKSNLVKLKSVILNEHLDHPLD